MGGKRSRRDAAFLVPSDLNARVSEERPAIVSPGRMDTRARCVGATKSGRPCPRLANVGSLYCGAHGPPSLLKVQERDILEEEVQEQIREALSRVGVPVWRNGVGGGRLASGQWITWGLAPGSADLIGLAPPYGRMLSIECKRPKGGVISPEQHAWAAFIRSMRGVAGFARSVDEALALADEARRLP